MYYGTNRPLPELSDIFRNGSNRYSKPFTFISLTLTLRVGMRNKQILRAIDK